MQNIFTTKKRHFNYYGDCVNTNQEESSLQNGKKSGLKLHRASIHYLLLIDHCSKIRFVFIL